MPVSLRHFTRKEVLRMLSITGGQLGHWERLELLQPQTISGKKVYCFGDLVSLRALKQLKEQRVPAALLRQAIQALRRKLADIEIPLTELRIRSHRGRVVIEYQGVAMDPISGQMVIQFEPDRSRRRVSAIPSLGVDSGLEDGFTLALEYEACPELRFQAIAAYRRVIETSPAAVEPRLNLGALLYEQGKLAAAADQFRCAVALAPQNPLAHFNLGTVLEDLNELAQAAKHLREALRLRPDYGDAHYNLARICEELNQHLEARRHWVRYLQLDPHSTWAHYARQRLGTAPRRLPHPA